MWACPHCQQPLQLNDSRSAWVCVANHQFDRAREGYVNLLVANRRGSRDPGDSAAMLAARRRVHQAGIYAPLAEELAGLVEYAAPSWPVLDLGCGEGYYSGLLKQWLPGVEVSGIDIARAGVKMAAKQYPSVAFAVASAFNLPLLDASQGLVLRVFAPSDEAELNRVLRPGAYYLEVTPAPSHMWELRQALYDQPRQSLPGQEAYPGLQQVQHLTMQYPVALDQDGLRDVVAMTPFAWRGHREKREVLLQSAGLSLGLAFSLRLFKKT